MQATTRALLSLLLILGLATFTLQQCTLSSSNDRLQSGSSVLYNARSATREHLFTVSTTLSVPNGGLQVAASVSSLQIAVTGGLDFSVRGMAGQSFGSVQIVLLIDEDNSWSTIRVSYLISGRTDFFLGFYQADIYLASKYSSAVTVQFTVPNWITSQVSHTAVVQYSGVRTVANSFAISFGSLSFSTSTGVITVVISSSFAVAIENIYITFIVFPNNSPISYSSFNPAVSAPGTYSFVGLENIRSAGSTFSGSAFTSSASNGINCVGSRCPTSCITAQMCTLSGGQVSGNTCFLCAVGQVIVNGNCQTASQCGQNQYWTGTQCSCVNGYVSVNGVCFQLCATNAYWLNNQCTCIPGFTYSNSARQCVQQSTSCGANYVWSNGNCDCPSPFGVINNMCMTCPPNSFVNNVGNCQCISGFALSSLTLTCVVQNNCWPNSTPNSLGQCVCNNGYYNQGNQCIPQTCPSGQVFNGITCVCPTGQFIDAITSQCTSCNSYGQAVQGNTCVCSPAFYPTSTGCAPCPANSVYNSTTRQCACLAGFTQSNGQCISTPSCPSGAQWSPSTSSCQCTIQGQYIINGACASCPANSQWNGTACQCQGNLVLIGNACTVACPLGSNWNGTLCVCSSGYNLIGGQCVVCDPNSSYNTTQATCLCNSGYYGNWQKCYSCDSSCATCSGPANTQCTSCRGTSSLNTNGGCTTGCPAGQYVNPNNNCSPCIANCALCYSGDSCTTCASGYGTSLSVVNGNIVIACTLVPTGTSSKLSLRSNVVGNGVVYQGVAMSLMPTQILADGCTICDSLLLVQIVSSYASATASVSFVTNSQYWFLITFDFTGAAFIPTFQFTVQINPIYANYFTSADMAQKLVSAINTQSQIAAPSAGGNMAIAAPNRPAGGFRSTVLPSPSEGASTPVPAAKDDKKILASVFG